MKKILFSFAVLVAVALAGLTTSCGGNTGGDDEEDVTPTQTTKVYGSSLNVLTGTPDEIENGLGADLGTITEDVKIELNSENKTLGLSIKGINLGKLENIPSALQAPFDIELNNVPYTITDGVYNISYILPIDEELMSTDLALDINGNKAYLISLIGEINASNLNLYIFVVGDEELMYIPVNILVEGVEK